MKKIIFILSLFFPSLLFAQTPTVGLIQHSVGSLDSGYVFFAPINSDTTYLIDKCGKKIHEWKSSKTTGLSAYLLGDGSILRTENIINPTFNGNGAAGGRIEKIDWNGNVIWSFTISNSHETQNHDVYPLANGNILVSVWVAVSDSQAIAAGRNPALLGSNLWSAKIIELKPIGTDSATIVWQWNLWDHLIQDFDSTKSNYGVVANHPELLNINFTGTTASTDTSSDWIHMNAITYNADLDQIMISAHNLSEIYIIDHSTTSAQAASHSGGTHGKGGDFLYRWGNPKAYDRGTVANRKLYLQHSPTWIPTGYKNSGEIMIFNNGVGRPGGNASSVDIIAPPIDSAGNYSISSGQAYGPTAEDWTYEDTVPTDFFIQNMGSAQRLSNGNTLIDGATTGDFFEIDSLKNKVWEYINPVSSTGPISQGTTSTSTQVFRCIFYPDSYSGFTGETLVEGNPIELNPYNYTCNLTTGINELSNSSTNIIVYPNPTTGIFSINCSEKINTIEIYNVLGQIIFTNKNTVSSDNIDLTGNPKGIYFLKVCTNENVFVRKIIYQ